MTKLDVSLDQPVETGVVDRDGFSLRYRSEGSGIPTLIIGSSLYYPRTFSQNLRKHLRLIFMDHRGFAPTPPGELDASGLTLDTLVEDIEYVRKTLGLNYFIIVGHSGHGYMALAYAKKYPAHVSHVVLIAMGPDQSHASHDAAERYFQEMASPERKAVLEKNIRFLPEELEEAPERAFITFCIRLGARSWYDYKFNAAPLWKDVEVNMSIIDHAWGVLFKDIDVTQGLSTFTKPVFLGLGRHDFLVAPAASWDPIRPKFKDLTVHIFEESSHTPQFEEPGLFDEELLRWISQHS